MFELVKKSLQHNQLRTYNILKPPDQLTFQETQTLHNLWFPARDENRVLHDPGVRRPQELCSFFVAHHESIDSRWQFHQETRNISSTLVDVSSYIFLFRCKHEQD